MGRAVRYLQDAQRTDGSWSLCGLETRATQAGEPGVRNKRALTHLSRLPEPYVSRIAAMQDKAVRWLLSVQNGDAGGRLCLGCVLD